ncbi:hypothetical protein GCM10018771_59130 [Streptomyces cellulosae]|nr:hypothetical protein GCM10018771_59130 [Streptomyces cellulosae]
MRPVRRSGTCPATSARPAFGDVPRYLRPSGTAGRAAPSLSSDPGRVSPLARRGLSWDALRDFQPVRRLRTRPARADGGSGGAAPGTVTDYTRTAVNRPSNCASKPPSRPARSPSSPGPSPDNTAFS